MWPTGGAASPAAGPRSGSATPTTTGPMTPVACTDADNCGLLCRRHHRLKTFTTWSWRRGDDGGIEWIDPNGVRWQREPIRYLMPEVPGSVFSESELSDSDVPVAKAPEPPAAQPEACSGAPPF